MDQEGAVSSSPLIILLALTIIYRKVGPYSKNAGGGGRGGELRIDSLSIRPSLLSANPIVNSFIEDIPTAPFFFFNPHQ